MPHSYNQNEGVRGRFVTRAVGPYHAPMLAVIWHYWIGVLLVIGAVGTLGALAVGYLSKVESTRYPKGE